MNNDPTQIAFGAGELFFAQFLPGTQTPASTERPLGNAPSFDITREVETYRHRDSRRGFRRTDEEVTIETTNRGNIVLDHAVIENFALAFMGTTDVLSTSAATSLTETFANVALGDVIQLGTSAANPSGVRKVTNVVVKNGATTYVLGTDYEVDLVLGRVRILATGTIAAAASVTVDYDIAASTRTRIISQDQMIEGALRYVSYNPKGARIDHFMPWVKIRPNGAINLITDGEPQQIPLAIEAMYKGSLAAIYSDGRPV